MRLSEKYKNWNQSRNLIDILGKKRLLIVLIILISLIIFGTIIWIFILIYTEDKPEFIPKEIRGEIREGIKENIAQPIASTIPSIGEPFVESAYKTNVTSTNQNIDNILTWKTYKNDELGFELKYPEGYIVDDSDEVISINKENNESGIWIYSQNSEDEINDWWLKEVSKYDSKFFTENVVINNNNFLKAVTEEGFGETHYFTKNNGRIIDFLIIGAGDFNEIVNSYEKENNN